ncbi:pentatricopeptide repeat-containing protein At2g34400 [Selaginella moellendorffii]|uniref:pentatricopeptide repeat-containing protein At2g34400 n=1 Tax=Selaginella moellendorffii TaxID=88036 RepID=UPI000D1CEC11|nr:pentatricopeptide repeat-containing protein At2g34400 [Selaginella moellendorffii]|eukprot:XP_024539672.1 pentatricopeptide repeat-containing protein At2g34400 [Selaginella moellendorffii]
MWLRRRGPSFAHFSSRVRRRVDHILRQSRENRKRGIRRARDPGKQNPPWYARDPAQLRRERQARVTRNQVELISRSRRASDVARALDSAKRAGVINDRNLRDLVVEKCSKLGCIEESRPMLESWLRKNTFSWSVVIAAFSQSGDFAKALQAFREMAVEGIKPSSFTLCAVVEACGEIGTTAIVRVIHESVELGEFSVKERFWDGLIAAYGKMGSVEDARRTFEGIEEKSLESWNAAIAACAQGGDSSNPSQALEFLTRMDLEGVHPNRETFFQIFCSFQGRIEFLELGRNIYRECCELGLKGDVRISSALIKMFSKCGSLRDARMVFEEIPCVDSSCSTAMIVEYVAHGVNEAALSLFKRLVGENRCEEGDCPPVFAAAINACTAMGDFSQGRKLHEQFVEKDLGLDAVIKTALVAMYGKRGDLAKAAEVFLAHALSIQDEGSWNSLMEAHARAGHLRQVLELLRRMDWNGMIPDGGTMLNVLVAIRHHSAGSSLVKRCREYFRSITADRWIEHTAEHYECVIDILARKGFAKEAKELIENMPYEPRPVMWKLFSE